MKSLILMNILLFVSLTAFSSGVATKTVYDSNALISLLGEIEISYEASGAFFCEEGLKKNKSLEWKCQAVTRKIVIDFLSEQAEYVLDSGILTLDEVEEAISDFNNIIGEGSFNMCTSSESSRYYYTEYVLFENLSTGYKVTFTIASER